jgi:hypothetical protein
MVTWRNTMIFQGRGLRGWQPCGKRGTKKLRTRPRRWRGRLN